MRSPHTATRSSPQSLPTRESLSASTKTQRSQKGTNKNLKERKQLGFESKSPDPSSSSELAIILRDDLENNSISCLSSWKSNLDEMTF